MSYGKLITDALVSAIITVAVVAFAVGALLAWGIPRLWAIVIPWLHRVTG